MWAGSRGSPECVRLLLEAGADSDIKSNHVRPQFFFFLYLPFFFPFLAHVYCFLCAKERNRSQFGEN
jgi:hypothetical protein